MFLNRFVRSIDARQRTIYVNVKLRVFINEQPEEPEYQSVEYKDVSGGKQVVVVGAGPGGLFAALRLIELGLRPVIIERGKNVRERKKDIALISREHTVNSEIAHSQPPPAGCGVVILVSYLFICLLMGYNR